MKFFLLSALLVFGMNSAHAREGVEGIKYYENEGFSCHVDDASGWVTLQYAEKVSENEVEPMTYAVGKESHWTAPHTMQDLCERIKSQILLDSGRFYRFSSSYCAQGQAVRYLMVGFALTIKGSNLANANPQERTLWLMPANALSITPVSKDMVSFTPSEECLNRKGN